jgi:hypothetical protein
MCPCNLCGCIGAAAIEHNNFVGELHRRKAIPEARRLVLGNDDDRKP